MVAPTKRERRAARRSGAREQRLGSWDALGAQTPYLGVVTDEGTFVVSTRSDKMSQHLFLKRARPEFLVLRRAVAAINALTGDAGGQFIDIGANIGTSTVCALRSHPFELAVCCEPEHENYRLLGANLAINDLDDVQRFRVAVSSRAGKGQLVVIGGPPGKTWIATDPQQIRDKEMEFARRHAEDPAYEPPTIAVSEIELVTLDGLVDAGAVDADRAGLLWIDVEGHEGHVLAGATRLIERGLPVVFEFDPEPLERRGDREAIHAVAEACYTDFVDMRRQDAERRRFELRPVRELRELAEQYLDPSRPGRFSDLLLLRLTDEQRAIDLPARMGKN